MKLVATAVLYTKQFGTKPGDNETVAKDLMKSLISADINAGKVEYTEDEVLAMLEYAYGRAGSKTPAKKAKLTWANYAKPSKQGWFAEVV
jgi:hypothetical protein